MPLSVYTDEEFIRIWNEYKSASKMSKSTGLDVSNLYRRRRAIEKRYNIELKSFMTTDHKEFNAERERAKLQDKINDPR